MLRAAAVACLISSTCAEPPVPGGFDAQEKGGVELAPVIDLGEGRPGETIRGAFEVKNLRPERTLVKFGIDAPFRLERSEVLLRTGETAQVYLSIRPDAEGPFEGRLRVEYPGNQTSVAVVGAAYSCGVVAPPSLAFDEVRVGDAGVSAVRYENTSIRAAQLSLSTSSTDLVIEPSELELGPGEAIEARVRYTRPFSGVFEADLLASTADGCADVVTRVRVPVLPPLSLVPAQLELPPGQVGSETCGEIFVENEREVEARIESIQIPPPFTVEPGGFTLPPFTGQRLSVCITPEVSGRIEGDIRLLSRPEGINGRVGITALARLTVSPSEINFGTITVNSTINGTVRVQAEGGGVDFVSARISPAGAFTVNAPGRTPLGAVDLGVVASARNPGTYRAELIVETTLSALRVPLTVTVF